MLLTITTTHRPATDLGYLLHKNPARVQSFELSFGKAHVFYEQADDDRCTAALLLEVDPIGLVRRRGPGTLDQYVNDRPYAASSFMSTAISRVFGSALAGRCTDKPDLVNKAIPLHATIHVLPSRGGEALLRRLFEPLGYEVQMKGHHLDERFPDWGQSPYYTVELTSERRLSELLGHLYVLIPVLDNAKHYWIGDDEVEKLLRHGEGWLAAHPHREEIARRYLRYRGRLTREALQRLVSEEEPELDDKEDSKGAEEEAVERRLSLNEARLGSVVAALRGLGAKRVVDLGCGEGKLIAVLMKDPSFEEIVGLDVSYRLLEIATERLHLDRLAPRQRERVKLLHGSLTHRDKRIQGFDAAAVVEVIEHFDHARLATFERLLFELARPGGVVITTPNREYNGRFEHLPAGALRHRDHRFEWTRQEFEAWAADVAQHFSYAVRFLPVGPLDAEVGSPTQMAVFTR